MAPGGPEATDKTSKVRLVTRSKPEFGRGGDPGGERAVSELATGGSEAEAENSRLRWRVG